MRQIGFLSQKYSSSSWVGGLWRHFVNFKKERLVRNFSFCAMGISLSKAI
jgi:hypothetical protein